MHAIIPVAGFGTRLRPHTYSQPKVLLNVAGRPILAHILDRLVASGITSVTIIVGYMGDAIEAYVRKTYPNLKSDFVEQTELKGLGHAIWMARERIPSDGSPLFIVLGDTIFEADLDAVFKSPTSSLGVFWVEDPRRFGIVELKDGFATKLIEKPENPTTNLMVAGLYFFRNPALLRQCLDELIEKNIRTRNEYQLTDALQLMVERGEKFSTFELKGWYDCGKPETLLSTNRHLLKSGTQVRPETRNTVIVEPVFIAQSAQIDDSIIGPFATIGGGARIKNSIVRDSIVGEGVRMNGVVIEQSLVGNNSSITRAASRINIGDCSEIELP
ncbi:MAG: sugar phosphate nucleotidyltransferase [Bacteroidota bacterium]|nr:sugar phosphate nucleotidyltransferase [Bacteroidota bacterium]MDP4231937.1 sugar phosphate nucleotidyltransferase [Bacteroidota bacterium]